MTSVPSLAPLELADGLLAVVRAQASPSARDWLASAVATARAPLNRVSFAGAFALAARQVGRSAPDQTTPEMAWLERSGLRWPITLWPTGV